MSTTTAARIEADGYNRGHADGYTKGYTDAVAEARRMHDHLEEHHMSRTNWPGFNLWPFTQQPNPTPPTVRDIMNAVAKAAALPPLDYDRLHINATLLKDLEQLAHNGRPYPVFAGPLHITGDPNVPEGRALKFRRGEFVGILDWREKTAETPAPASVTLLQPTGDAAGKRG